MHNDKYVCTLSCSHTNITVERESLKFAITDASREWVKANSKQKSLVERMAEYIESLPGFCLHGPKIGEKLVREFKYSGKNLKWKMG
jgi:hypothetical protein